MSGNLAASALTSPKGIPYSIKAGPYTHTDLHGKTTMRMEYLVDAVNYLKFLEELLPTPRRVISGGVPVITLDPSWKLPNYTGKNRFFSAETVDAEPFSDEMPTDLYLADPRAAVIDSTLPNEFNSGPYSPYCLVTVTYATNFESRFLKIRSNLDPRNLLEPSFNATVEMLSVYLNRTTKTVLEGVSSSPNTVGGTQPKELSAPMIKLIPIVERSFRWGWALNPDFTTIFSLIGTVNQHSLTWVPGAASETVLFVGLTGKQTYRLSQGDLLISPWDLEYKFAQRQFKDGGVTLGWNHVYVPENARFERLYRELPDGTKRPLYELNAFTDLFKVL